ncbi:MAG: methylenetetrahydrofolate reductase [Magnetococcus sp. DMHC-6]
MTITMRISIELVPRNEAALLEELAIVRHHLSGVETINIPDLPRFDVRSWSGCVLTKQSFPHAIPHIRAIDLHPDRPLPMGALLVAHGIDEVLIITGDSIPGAIPRGSSLEIIRKFKKELPHIKIYAALDPYRSSIQQELDYLKQKLEAGADGFFTQPFFDIRFMEIYADLLAEIPIFWGISPVTTERSQAYWTRRNRVVFPKRFQPTLEWNQHFAKQALIFAKERGGHLYFMPIQTDIRSYLEPILQ